MAWASTIKSFGAVVITGGSSGIGTAFIRTLQNVGSSALICNLSRSIPEGIQGNLRLTHHSVDLSRIDAVKSAGEWVIERLKPLDPAPILLINNAGFGHYGVFGAEGHDELGMIDVNVRAVVGLTERLLPILRERGGWIINVASVAGFQPVPYLATYAGTKAFVMHWSLALDEELRGSGVRSLAVCPGPTSSQFFIRAGFKRPPNGTPGQTPEAVVEETFRALGSGRSLVVTGWRNRLMACAVHFLSKSLTARVGRLVMRKLRLEELQKEPAK